MTQSIEKELSAITSFLCERYPSVFRKDANYNTIEVKDPFEAIILASSVKDSFFLKRNPYGRITDYPIYLPRDFTGPWAVDYYRDYPDLFKGKKTIRFFPQWISVKGYSGKDAHRRAEARTARMLESLYAESKRAGEELGDALYVPYYEYSKDASYQFSESIYHYLSGMIFRELGYLVFDEYTPSIITGSLRTPDLSAFGTRTIREALSTLKSKGMISKGAFEQELQLYSIFKRKSSIKFDRGLSYTVAQSIAIEVKRSESQYLVKKGTIELDSYLAEAFGFYDEGYLVAPLIEGKAPGTITFQPDGTFSFVPAKHINAEPSDLLLERRNNQLKDVRRNMMMQLLKNTPFWRIGEVSGKVHSFDDLWYTLGSIDVESLTGKLV